MYTISSNSYSVEMQADGVLDWMRLEHPEQYSEVKKQFPENIVFSGSAFDTEKMGVDIEWGNWLVDALEETGVVMWWEGEPWAVDGCTAAIEDQGLWDCECAECEKLQADANGAW